MNTRSVRTSGKAAEKFASLQGKHVIIYYRDMRDTDRKLHGIITEVDGDVLHLQNGDWNGILVQARPHIAGVYRRGLE